MKPKMVKKWQLHVYKAWGRCDRARIDHIQGDRRPNSKSSRQLSAHHLVESAMMSQMQRISKLIAQADIQ